MNDLSGTTIGLYELKAIIGKGGMATVYRAYQPTMDRDVALKVMSPDLASEPEFVNRFEREARIVAQLQHPHIVSVYDFGRENSYLYLVMKLLSGGNLSQALRSGPLPPKRVIELTRQIASALDYAHRRGIVHRDLKPSNVLLDEKGAACLTDFGIAKMLGGSAVTGLTAPNAVMGTPTYMAPEQWRSEPVDGRTDVYALGIIVYQMLLGQVPFAAETPHGLMYQHLDRTPRSAHEINPDLPLALDRVLRRALAKQPEDRYPTAGDLANELDQALTSPMRMPEQTAYDVQPPERPMRRPPREEDWVEQDLLSRAEDDQGGPDFTIPSRASSDQPTLNPTMPSRAPQYVPPSDPRPSTPREPEPNPFGPPVQPRADQALYSSGYTPPVNPYQDYDYADEEDSGGLTRVLWIVGSVIGAVVVLFGVVLVLVLLFGVNDNNSPSNEVSPTVPPAATGIPTPTSAAGQPSIVVEEPTTAVGADLGEVVAIRFRASSPNGLTRIDLQRFGRVLDSIPLGNVTDYEGTFAYQPDSTGTHVLQVVAFHDNVASPPATVTIIAR